MKSSSFSSNNLRLTALAIFLMSLLMSISAFSSQSLENPLLPSDGESVTVQPIEPFYPEVNGYWDMSQSYPVRTHFDIRFNWVNDTILMATLPGVSYSFITDGDCVKRIKSESHYIRLNDTIPMLTGILKGNVTDTISQFASKGRAFKTEYIESHGDVSLSLMGYGQLILPLGDTVNNVSLIKHHSRQSMSFSLHSKPNTNEARNDKTAKKLIRNIYTYIWKSPEYLIPLAQTTVISDSIEGKVYGEKEMSTWICPPNEQLPRLNNDAIRYKSPDAKQSRNNTNGMMSFGNVSVNAKDGCINVNYNTQADLPIEFILTDLTGRVFASNLKNHYTGNGNGTWSAKDLPSGRYILYIKQGDEPSVAYKLILD